MFGEPQIAATAAGLISRRVAVLCLAAATMFAGCSDRGQLGPPVPSGATGIGGPPVTSAPPPPSGWSPKDVVPQSQQQDQDTLLDYQTRTLRELPEGTCLTPRGMAVLATTVGVQTSLRIQRPRPRATTPRGISSSRPGLTLMPWSDARATSGEAGVGTSLSEMGSASPMSSVTGRMGIGCRS